nr:PREDICTED: uncharacterized protein LOC109040695 [Bemisia tabaci]
MAQLSVSQMLGWLFLVSMYPSSTPGKVPPTSAEMRQFSSPTTDCAGADSCSESSSEEDECIGPDCVISDVIGTRRKRSDVTLAPGSPEDTTIWDVIRTRKKRSDATLVPKKTDDTLSSDIIGTRKKRSEVILIEISSPTAHCDDADPCSESFSEEDECIGDCVISDAIKTRKKRSAVAQVPQRTTSDVIGTQNTLSDVGLVPGQAEGILLSHIVGARRRRSDDTQTPGDNLISDVISTRKKRSDVTLVPGKTGDATCADGSCAKTGYGVILVTCAGDNCGGPPPCTSGSCGGPPPCTSGSCKRHAPGPPPGKCPGDYCGGPPVHCAGGGCGKRCPGGQCKRHPGPPPAGCRSGRCGPPPPPSDCYGDDCDYGPPSCPGGQCKRHPGPYPGGCPGGKCGGGYGPGGCPPGKCGGYGGCHGGGCGK